MLTHHLPFVIAMSQHPTPLPLEGLVAVAVWLQGWRPVDRANGLVRGWGLGLGGLGLVEVGIVLREKHMEHDDFQWEMMVNDDGYDG